MLGIMVLGSMVELLWGAGELLTFIVIVNVATAMSTFVTMYIFYIITASQEFLFAKVCGFHGVLVGLTVALRRIMPEERLPGILGTVAGGFFRYKHVPLGIILGTTALTIALEGGGIVIGDLLFVLFGAYWGWAYLRFFQVRSNTELNRNKRPSIVLVF